MKIVMNSTQPLYQQIEEQLKESILKEELKEGDTLPSIRSFAADLGVSVLTIRRVYDDLEAEGFLTQQAGLGTFVSAINLELLKDARRRRIEQQMQELLKDAGTLHIPLAELHDMLDILYESQ